MIPQIRRMASPRPSTKTRTRPDSRWFRTEFSPGSSLSLRRFAEHGGVVQLDDTASSLLWGINHASIKWPRVNMQADRAFAKVFGIDDAVNWISGIYGARIRRIHLDSVGGR